MTTQNVSIDQVQLDRTTRTADLAVRSVLDAGERLAAGDLVSAAQHIRDADTASQSVYLALVRAGGDAGPGSVAPQTVPIELLDTPATRRLLDALQFAVSCAQEVDTERGWTLASGEGCGMVDTIGDIAEALRQQVEGPKGRD